MKQRLITIDFAKGIAILVMIGLHYLYVLTLEQYISSAIVDSLAYVVVSRVVACTFIALSTVVLWHRAHATQSRQAWMHSIAKQVLKLSAAALLVTLATRLWLGEPYVRFGILHLLASATLINGVLFRVRLPRWWYVAFGLIVILVGNWLLFWRFPVIGWEWLGLMSTDFTSIDYVPILPWLGLTWLTAALAPTLLGWLKTLEIQLDTPHAAQKKQWRWLSWCGRHSMTLYLAHIPVVLSLLWLGDQLF